MISVVVRSLCLVIVGVLMILLREAFMPFIIQFVGAAFIVSGIISLFNVYLLYKRGLARAFDAVTLSFTGVASAVFGTWLLLSPEFFLSLLMTLLGVLLIVIGFYQLIGLLAARKSTKIWGIMYVIPVLLLLAGIFVIVNPFAVAGLPFLVVGFAAMLAGISDLSSAILFKKKTKSLE